jgi:hypothetical protein
MGNKKPRPKRKNDPALRQALRDRKQAVQIAITDFYREVLRALKEYPTAGERLRPFVGKTATKRRRAAFEELLRQLRSERLVESSTTHIPMATLLEYLASWDGFLPLSDLPLPERTQETDGDP